MEPIRLGSKLRGTHDVTVDWRHRVLQVQGQSRSGKTTLAQHFVEQVTLQGVTPLVYVGNDYAEMWTRGQVFPRLQQEEFIDEVNRRVRDRLDGDTSPLVVVVDTFDRLGPGLRDIRRLSRHAEALDVHLIVSGQSASAHGFGGDFRDIDVTLIETVRERTKVRLANSRFYYRLCYERGGEDTYVSPAVGEF